MSRLSRIGLPLSNVSSTANKRLCFCNRRAIAYKMRARPCPPSAAHFGCALRAAETARFTSAWVAWLMVANTFPVAGFLVSKPSPALVNDPSIKWPNLPPWSTIQAKASAVFSGAVPKSMVWKISLTVMVRVFLSDVVDGKVWMG